VRVLFITVILLYFYNNTQDINLIFNTMNKIIFQLFVLFIFLNTYNVFGQQNKLFNQDLTLENIQSLQETGHIRCGSVEYEKHLQETYPERYTTDAFETWLASKKEETIAYRMANPNVVLTIPVVFHVFTDGSGPENVSATLIQAQINQLNIDYRNLAGSGYSQAGDAEIEFCLAQQDENGSQMSEPGINRITAYGGGQFSNTDFENSMKAQTQWDPTKYFNVWVADLSGGLLGYAYWPETTDISGVPSNSAGADHDGVVLLYSSVGSVANPNPYGGQYAYGRTLTHEAGHWLGLRHIWGDNTICGGNGDYCDDTPDANTEHYNCNTYDTCPDDGLGNDMVENYMDYTNDLCMDTFTNDQVSRMITVMNNSPRRVELTTSNVCNVSAPYIKFNNGPGTVIENTQCGYQEYNITLSIAQAPSADATVTITIDGGTATENLDYYLPSNTITFLQGETVDKTLVVRIYRDGFVEGDETVTFGMTIDTTGDAEIIGTSENQYELTITDDDEAHTASTNSQIFYDDFSDGDASDWTIIDNNDQPDDDWFIAEESNWETPFGLYTDYFMVSYSWNGEDYSPDNFLCSPAISIPADATSAELSFLMGAANDDEWYFENYQVWATNSISSVTDITNGTLLADATLPDELAHDYDYDLSAFAGQTIYIVFRHHDTTGQWLIGVDEVGVDVVIGATIQTEMNQANAYEVTMNIAESIYASDADNGNVMGVITSNANIGYGCISTYVSRDEATAGAAAVMFNNPSTMDYVMAKQFTVAPAADYSSTDLTISFYLTEAEIAAWETATGNTRTSLRVLKNTTVGTGTSLDVFGDGWKITANFADGLGGNYQFGTQDSTVGVKEYVFNSFVIYPNPSDGIFNIQLESSNSEEALIQLFDIRGRLINQQSIGNQSTIQKQVDFGNVSEGVYLMKVTKGNESGTQKLVIQ
jgi:hypothetical protein